MGGMRSSMSFRTRRRVSKRDLRRFERSFWLILLIVSLTIGGLCVLQIVLE